MDKPWVIIAMVIQHHVIISISGIVGLGVNLSDHVTMSIDYRYFTTKEGRFETTFIVFI